MIPFSPPFIDKSVVDEVIDTLKSGWITTGPKVRSLEANLADYVGIAHALCVNSWTSGAILVLRWLGLKEGDEVIIPTYTYSATALAVLHAGGRPVMVDIDGDFNIDVKKIRNKISSRTKAIMPVDFAGWPCDYNALFDMVDQPSIKDLFEPNGEVQSKIGRIMIIADSAHSLGATYMDKKIGSVADISIFSLHAVKNVTTAEGGAIMINLPRSFDNGLVYEQLKLRTLNCQTKDAYTKTNLKGWRYDIVGLGMKINMPDINAAIGLAQLKKYPEWLKKRQSIYEQYMRLLSPYDWILIPKNKDDNKSSSCHILPIRIRGKNEVFRDKLIDELTNMEISVNVHFIPLPMLTYFKELGYDINDYPVSNEMYSNEISLPIYPQLNEVQINKICESLVIAYNKLEIAQ